MGGHPHATAASSSRSNYTQSPRACHRSDCLSRFISFKSNSICSHSQPLYYMMFHPSLSKPSISAPVPLYHPSKFASSNVQYTSLRIRCGEFVSSDPKATTDGASITSIGNHMQVEVKGKSGPYPGGMPGAYTGRDPNVKKPEWLRQRAPQGEKFDVVKEQLSRLNLNTVCEEAQCPNIGEVLQFSLLF